VLTRLCYKYKVLISPHTQKGREINMVRLRMSLIEVHPRSLNVRPTSVQVYLYYIWGGVNNRCDLRSRSPDSRSGSGSCGLGPDPVGWAWTAGSPFASPWSTTSATSVSNSPIPTTKARRAAGPSRHGGWGGEGVAWCFQILPGRLGVQVRVLFG